VESTPKARPQAGSTPAPEGAGSAQESQQALLPAEEADSLWERWQEVQTAFVDNPRSALEQANDLVAEVMRRLTETFTQEQGSFGGAVVKRRGRDHRGDARGTATLPLLLRAPAPHQQAGRGPLAGRLMTENVGSQHGS
jgi:hypothetical protein